MLSAMDSCFGVLERQGLPVKGLASLARTAKQFLGAFFGLINMAYRTKWALSFVRSVEIAGAQMAVPS